jgi:hypothetical protein
MSDTKESEAISGNKAVNLRMPENIVDIITIRAEEDVRNQTEEIIYLLQLGIKADDKRRKMLHLMESDE